MALTIGNDSEEPATRPFAGRKRRRSPFGVRLFDPSPLFRHISAWLAPFRAATYLIWPSAILACFAAAFNWYDLLAHTDRVLFSVSFLQKLVISMLTANLFSKIVMGAAMSYHRADTNEFGIRLILGVLPRFYIATAPIQRLGFRRQRACYAAPLLTKLSMFSAGILLWAVLVRSGSGAADAALAMGLVGLGSFLFTLNPLWPADGYRWFAAYMERPKLRDHAFRLLKMLLTRKPLPDSLGRREAWALGAFALLSVAFTAFLAYVVLTSVAYALEAQFRGAGVAIFAVLLALMLLFLLGLRQGKGRRGRNGGGLTRQASRPARAIAARASDRLSIAASPERADGALGPAPEGDEYPMNDEQNASFSATRPRGRFGLTPRARKIPEDAESPETARPAGAGGAPVPKDEAAADPLDEVLSDRSIWEGQADGSDAGDGGARHDAAQAPEPAPVYNPDLEEILSAEIEPEPAGNGEADELEQILSALSVEEQAAGPRVLYGELQEAATPWAGAELPATGDGADAGRDAGLLPAPVPGRGLRRRGEAGTVRELQTATAGDQALAAPRGIDDLDRVLNVGSAAKPPVSKWRRRFVWAVVLAALYYVAMLPYPFEVGGEFVIQPLERAQVRARTDGEIIDVSVREGDWVERGDIIAVLSNWDEKRDIAVREAEIAKLEAELETLLLGPRPEEVVVAEQNLASAELQVGIAAQELSRQEQLFGSGTVSAKALEEARSRFQIAEASREEASAGLALVASSARESEIAAARAGIARNEEDLAYSRLQLEHTNVRAAVGGQVVSSLSEVPVGAFLPEGGLFAELEDNRTVIAEIEVPETEIEEVAIGARVELKLWSAPKESIYGTVQRVAPKAEEREFGRVMRVLVEVPNPDAALSANMTGFGKIAADERPVWEAFTRVFVRLFQVEIWSWLP